MKDVIVPKWGQTMDEAILVTWLKGVGDHVDANEGIAEIETDKANGYVESEEAGIICEILVEAGSLVEPGQVIARLTIDSESNG